MKDSKRTIIIAIAASAVLHLMLLLVAFLYFDRVTYTPPKEQVVMIDLRDEPKQIADIMKPLVEKRPEEAKHIGMFDSTAPEETVASETIRAPGRPAKRGGEGMDEVKKKMSDYSFFKNEMEKEKKKKRSKEKGDEEEPSFSFNKTIPEDFYPDYKQGAHTYINVLKHPDVGYFVRLKRVFKLAWDPTSVLRRRSMTGEVSRGSIKVVLGLSIGKTGELDELFVINSSGMADYDQEALRAVKASAPFSSPPVKLLADDGILHVAWTFIVYL